MNRVEPGGALALFVADCLRLKSLIGLEGEPVCVAYREQLPAGRFSIEDQVICQSLQDARHGKEVAISADSSRCKGGSYFTGLLAYGPQILDFWVRLEKTHSNSCAAFTYLQSIPPPPTHVGKYLALSPAGKCTELPDLVAFVCSPSAAARLLGLHVFRAGRPAKIFSYAAACAAAIGIPMATGEPHLSLIDNSARVIAGFEDGELIVTVPATAVRGMAEDIDRCIWGTAQAPYLEIEKRLKGTWRRPGCRGEEDAA